MISGTTGRGGQSAPDIFHQEIFADLSGKKGEGKKWKMKRKRRKI